MAISTHGGEAGAIPTCRFADRPSDDAADVYGKSSDNGPVEKPSHPNPAPADPATDRRATVRIAATDRTVPVGRGGSVIRRLPRTKKPHDKVMGLSQGFGRLFCERKTGFEPATLSLGS